MPDRKGLAGLPTLVAEQQHLNGPFVSTVYGPIEYRDWQKRLKRIDEILVSSGIEQVHQQLSLARRNEQEKVLSAKEGRKYYTLTAVEQASFQSLCTRVLRLNVARLWMGLSFREFACRVADSPFLHWFAKLDRIGGVRVPGKSALERYSKWLPEEDLREVMNTLLIAASAPAEENVQRLELAEALDLGAYFLDTTCVKLPIHFPIDWVLLRDAARTLLKATILIRKRGLKARMEEPSEFLKRMNQLCMKMTHAGRKKDSKRAKKAVLRQMKKLSKLIAAHAERHRDLLAEQWRETELKQGQAQQIQNRITTVLERLPVAIRQAHERIIGGRKLLNEEKILSLYEGHAAVYVRGKAGAEVEFGSQLLLGESERGVIVDWELVCGNPKADTKMLQRSLDRMKEAAPARVLRQVVGDRGFDSKANRQLLEKQAIYNAICPKAPADLKARMKEGQFAELQKRRSQTEARIAIFKNGYLGNPLSSKGHEHQKQDVAWCVLAHNLWVLARLPKRKAAALAKAG